MLEYIRKRDGRIVKFNDDRITRAIFLAASEVAKEEGAVPSYDISEELTQKAIDLKDDIKKVPDEMYCKINGLEVDELIDLKKSLDKMLKQLGK